MTRTPRRVLLFPILAAALCAFASAQTCLDIGGANPTNRFQNFDGLGSSPAPQNSDATNILVLNAASPRRFLGKFDNAHADNGNIVNVPGWALVEEGSHMTSVSGRYSVGDGSIAGGNTFSFASASANGDRAFGSLNDDTIPLNMLGACFRNTTGATVAAVQIGYTGELWRLGGSGAPDRLNFQYAVNAANIYSGTYKNFDALDFATPNLTGTAGARDGNAAAFRTIFPLRILNVTLAPSDTLYLRWVDANIAGADDGLAVDDFEIQLAAPLAAEVSLSGRVTDANGRGLARSRITVTGAAGTRSVLTNAFGNYRVENLRAGEVYVLSVWNKQHTFAEPTRAVNLDDALSGIDFVAEP